MHTDELTESTRKMLAGFEDMAAKMAPKMNEMLEQMVLKRKLFLEKKEAIEKEINHGARTTKHRLHL